MNKSNLMIILFALLVVMLSAQKTSFTEPRIEKRGEFHVMGLQLKDSLDGAKLTQLWIDYYRLNAKIPEPVYGVEYGIKYFGKDFDPATMKGFYYLVGSEVKSLGKTPEPLNAHTVPSATYLVFEHRGSIADINHTYSHIFNHWFPKSKYKPAPQDVFEKYDARYKLGAADSLLEIWVPISL
ncbi:MAG: GyrI-like domain-containing protein [Candidatus Cloacimonadaceae bacterium]|nr:GyrI-like domain-containing protein [Candidatus Cloacimonadaceae bacterium]